ncbi:ABC transporter ATP-binding protein [Macrococcoides caseolyticum]|uniref:ABC transporter ATP-binding protein n=1 Tax=Macrococcoides caseolyticum TaxID=69966 RepID=UPI001F2DF6A5|nr:ABC transporter ATP-binding protein [Macrococcus caseolyticus]MCE4956578.1 ABC transporter ATP-binding protein [Macrococcus caseolyticus]
MTLIQMNNVVKMYDSKKAVDHLSLDINQGEIFGLLGPSGSGKTTTIKMLTGETSISNGSIQVFHYHDKALQTPEYREQIGILSDNSALYERLTVFDNLKMFSGLYKQPLNRIVEVLAFVQLENEKKTVVKKLSKGMRQRILLAKALLHQPKLLFLDEPTSALDPNTTRHIHKGLLKLKENGTTIFLTTHDMDEAESLCDRIALIDNGKLIALDTPDNLRYRHSDQTIIVEMNDLTHRKVHKEDVVQITELLNSKQVKRIYTNEPTLGEVFIKVTGKELV